MHYPATPNPTQTKLTCFSDNCPGRRGGANVVVDPAPWYNADAILGLEGVATVKAGLNSTVFLRAVFRF